MKTEHKDEEKQAEIDTGKEYNREHKQKELRGNSKQKRRPQQSRANSLQTNQVSFLLFFSPRFINSSSPPVLI